ncbi:uncharacterized protein MYCFIDRAFT_82397 [Pseudocercospora fijiensis CIRAD86]|uniref:Myb-like DNA-binding domain-containing protein n=1 Tax=Pseudocercospora fijiensis (strain CIRAD86) TaxID=383855 RepID=M3AZ76_PSEFD|nr:uncharacterized protein MYCFIDRAFT_82397 [Pseudocercospora fijiensis CIRAD86]EME82488.1 hypothetical protein MYCFIDRAFT_82397 [Pseudocercospora fijiensis CIRAD86]
MSDEAQTPTGDATFTPAEVKFILAAIKNAEGGTFKFDAEAVAQELGMKDAGSVKARWNTINRKKIQVASSPAGGVDKTTPTKKNPTPKKAADGDKTPKKRGRPKKVSAAADVTAEKEPTPEKKDDEEKKAEGGGAEDDVKEEAED